MTAQQQQQKVMEKSAKAFDKLRDFQTELYLLLNIYEVCCAEA